MKTMWRSAFPAILLFVSATAALAGKAERVVLIVWDGMRPDFVTAEHTPVLHALAQSGVTFTNHHSIYPTSTEVNGTALATGVYPNRSGILANKEFRPELDPLKYVDTQGLAAVRRSDELNAGRHIAMPTLAELIQRAGFPTAVAGTKAVAMLFDRALARADGAAAKSATLFEGQTLPTTALEAITARQGAVPLELPFPDVKRNEWTASVLLEDFWKSEVPKLSVLWMSEPDFSQHRASPGSPAALAALRGNDAILGKLLATLDARGLRETTDVLIVSDHGFSTVSRIVDVPTLLVAAGFRASRVFKEQPKRGDIMMVGNGGTLLFYVTERDETVVRSLVEYLQRSDFASVIFSRLPIEGAFGLADARLDTPGAPDVVLALGWNDDVNKYGAAGTVLSDIGRKAGQGTHATLSRHDVHNTLIAAGPDFKRAWSNPLPSANVDVAPTILAILGVSSPQPLDGRVLSEAFIDAKPGAAAPKAEGKTAVRTFDDGAKWTQELSLTKYDGRVYLDEGRGYRSPPAPNRVSPP